MPIFDFDSGSYSKDSLDSLTLSHLLGTFTNPQLTAWEYHAYRCIHKMAFHTVGYMVIDGMRSWNAITDGSHERLNFEHWPHGHLYDKQTAIVQISFSVL